MEESTQNPRDPSSNADASWAVAHQFKLEDDAVEVDTEDATLQHSTNYLPSFNGRLNILDFAFTPEASVRKESLPASRRSQAVTATPSLKRKTSPPNRNTSVSSSKRPRKPSGYAAPSTYAHLKPLPDTLAPNLICLFVGLNPGVQTSVQGHAYAHPSNLFWKLLHSSGCTTRRCRPSEGQHLPALFALGNTNIVSRPTRNGSELSKREMDESVAALEEKVRKWRPECVCFVGKSIWESVWRVRRGREIKKEEFRYGWQDEGENVGRTSGNARLEFESQNEEGSLGVNADVWDWKGAKVFVAASTSGLAASLLPAEKEKIWRELGVWVEQRRLERSLAKREVHGESGDVMI